MSIKTTDTDAKTSASGKKDEFEVLMKSSKSYDGESPRQDVGH